MSLINDSAIHIQSVRRALANGNAAVMVGAGFSRNAEGGEQLKMWGALGQELWTSLNPTVERKEFPPSLVTQLAEQYARVFSTPALENVLKQHIPDDRVMPGPLHTQLVDLAWCEIFTTNYDTLLERAADQLLNRAHFTVCCREDIPQSKILGRRRIVKLHGSFPSHRPFIFTEEDYRQYPEQFAPFVNLVRQSMLENVFCLIGFSGEDPNFLHWIGWVRDMLDQHALPIYLFTDREPTFGERKLLEVRRVTPVTLPQPAGNAKADYAQRLAELFRQLAEPLKSSPSTWGKVQWPLRTIAGTETDAQQFEWLLGIFPLVVELRDSYPGWMVAPHVTRRRLKATLENLPISLEDRWVHAYLERQQPAAVGLVFLSHYAWLQDTLLLPLLDSAAELGIRVLKATGCIVLDAESDACRGVLKRLGVGDQRTFDQRWRQLALALVQWARQGMRDSLHQELCSIIRTARPEDTDAADQLQYESIVLCLYQGERQHARALLAQWDVRSSDPYMRFRKGVLLAELGTSEVALDLCSEAIRLLRRSQKIRPESALLLSQEAWACFVINHMRAGWKLFSPAVRELSPTDEYSDNGLNRRLLDLAAKGFDPRAEINAAKSALNAEAAPPSEPRYEAGDFDLGHVRTFRNLTWPSELTEKVDAAFVWLTLTERVGLVPRFAEISNDPTSFTKAGWWIQFADSTRRMLSVGIRTMSPEIFKPKEQSQTSGRTGWLSRYQIARMDSEFAQEICERSLRQVEEALSANVDVQRTCSFYLELFSRLILRVDALDQVRAMAERLIVLHGQVAVGGHSRTWSIFGRALARCFEATPASDHLHLICQVVQLPLLPPMPQGSHFLEDWLQLHRVRVNIPAGADIPPSLSEYVDRLIEQLDELQGSAPQKRAIWNRLIWLDAYSVLSEEQRKRVGRTVWRGVETWPLIPGYAPSCASLWPAPNTETAAELFREWLLRAGVVGFRHPSAAFITMKGEHRGWGLPGNHTFFKSWLESLRMAPWPERTWIAALGRVLQWWHTEAEDLSADLQRHDDLFADLMHRLELFDSILAHAELWSITETSDEVRSLIDGQIRVMVDAGRTMGAPYWRFRIEQTRRTADPRSWEQLGTEIAAGLVAPRSADTLQSAAAAALLWIEKSLVAGIPTGLVIDTVVAILTSRNLPSLSRALDLLIQLLRRRLNVLDAVNGALVNLALGALMEELNYAGRPIGSAIPDDEVPTLRFLCARFSSLIVETEATGEISVAEQWLHVAGTDPLPEMRFGRYKVAHNDAPG